MSVQSAQDVANVPFLLSGNTLVKESETLFTDAGRTTPLVRRTLMAQIAATLKWVPFTDETATDGTAIAKGIYMGDDITAAAIAAADVVDLPIAVGGAAATFDSAQLVIENSKLLTTVVDAAAVSAHIVSDDLASIGLFAEATVDITAFENA